MGVTDYMTTREEATFIWLAIGLAACMFSKDIRQSLVGIGRSMAKWKVFVPLLVFAGLIVAAAWLVDRIGFWNQSLTGAVVIWFLFTGFRYFLNISDVPKGEHFFREKLVELVGLSALFEFLLSIRTFSLFVELPLLFFITVLTVMQLLAAAKDETRPVARILGSMLGVTGLLLVFLTAQNLINHRFELDGHELASLFLVPVWLTVVTLPYLYLLALVAGYESLFLAMRRGNDHPANRPVRLGALMELRGSTKDIAEFRGQRLYEAVTSGSLRGTRLAVRAMRVDRAEREAADVAAARRLKDNAGMTGTDDDGRQLDEREFEETRAALQWLANCHMGWYRREEDGGRYRTDLLDRLSNDFTRQGLPPDSGIVMHVRADGQAWYAYRRTITG